MRPQGEEAYSAESHPGFRCASTESICSLILEHNFWKHSPSALRSYLFINLITRAVEALAACTCARECGFHPYSCTRCSPNSPAESSDKQRSGSACPARWEIDMLDVIDERGDRDVLEMMARRSLRSSKKVFLEVKKREIVFILASKTLKMKSRHFEDVEGEMRMF